MFRVQVQQAVTNIIKSIDSIYTTSRQSLYASVIASASLRHLHPPLPPPSSHNNCSKPSKLQSQIIVLSFSLYIIRKLYYTAVVNLFSYYHRSISIQMPVYKSSLN